MLRILIEGMGATCGEVFWLFLQSAGLDGCFRSCYKVSLSSELVIRTSDMFSSMGKAMISKLTHPMAKVVLYNHYNYFVLLSCEQTANTVSGSQGFLSIV
jgi:hypothetical protein